MSETTTSPAQATTNASEAPAAGTVMTADMKPASSAAPPAATDSQNPPATKTAETAKQIPEKYELKLPEGSYLKPTSLEKIAAIAKQHGLSNEQAQGLVENEHQAIKSYADEQKQQHQQTVESWMNQVKADPQLGGEAFQKNAELAKRAVEKFGSPEFIKALNETGFGNHPELVRVFNKIGKAMAEDTLVNASQQGGVVKSQAERLYGPTKEN